tara:strand:- start:1298 stop:3139 length:1842 start_codon:yes stop_codon:yes gene_type:complete
MCGLFGILNTNKKIDTGVLRKLAKSTQRRGRDASGICFVAGDTLTIKKQNSGILEQLTRETVRDIEASSFCLGHSRLITNGYTDNQPIVRDDVIVFHNGIITNDTEIWENLDVERHLQVDSEVIAAIIIEFLRTNTDVRRLPEVIFDLCEGSVSALIVLKKIDTVLVISNTGSMYVGDLENGTCIGSESYALTNIGAQNVKQVNGSHLIKLNTGIASKEVDIIEDKTRSQNPIPNLNFDAGRASLLQYVAPDIQRCSKCIMPETMPYILFNGEGVCNYCENYRKKNTPKPFSELANIVDSYRRHSGKDCIIPFSGGRDSSYALHLVTQELKLKPITYTYDWGMVTDLARRNISRMCATLGVENITVAADISKKRQNVRKNLIAWLKSPNLGMMSILTAGDKHFFKYVEDIKNETGIHLNIWGVNPLEVTHFKSGFLGIPPSFSSNTVYSTGLMSQLRYQSKRLSAMLDSPQYFNSSIKDTLSGEYYRSMTKRRDYFHLFDYIRWDESTIEETLKEYSWEFAPDTNSSWRIGDGTAGFYNYVYYTVAGFTEHDTFRSNQIREGDMTRCQALELVMEENQPRYENIKWYLDILDLDFQDVIETVNNIPKLYKPSN